MPPELIHDYALLIHAAALILTSLGVLLASKKQAP